MSDQAYRARAVATVLLPAILVFALCVLTGGWFFLVLLTAAVTALGCPVVPGALRLTGLGLLLGCLAVFLVAAAHDE